MPFAALSAVVAARPVAGRVSLDVVLGGVQVLHELCLSFSQTSDAVQHVRLGLFMMALISSLFVDQPG